MQEDQDFEGGAVCKIAIYLEKDDKIVHRAF